MIMTEFRGVIFALICVFILAFNNLYFNEIAEYDFNFLAFSTVAMMFCGFSMLLIGGKTRFAYDALKSMATWFYGLFFLIDTLLVLLIVSYVNATDASLIGRSCILISLLASVLFAGRDHRDALVFGSPFLIAGVSVVFLGLDSNELGPVIFLTIALGVARSLKLFAIEKNKATIKSKCLRDDLSVIGYVLGCTSLGFMVILGSIAILGELTHTILPKMPTLADFYNINMLVFSAIYGLILMTMLRFFEFKAVTTIKTEIFAAFTALVPLVTMVLELTATSIGITTSEQNFTVDAAMLGANMLIIIGSIIIVVKRYTASLVTDDALIEDVKRSAESALIFSRENFTKASDILGVKTDMLVQLVEKPIDQIKIPKDVAKKIKENYVNNIAMSDALTGLPNRLQFLTQLKRIDKETPFHVYFIDLNRFKPVNDTYGHKVGDEMLVVTADRLSTLFEGKGIVSRLGGDEFAAVILNEEKEKAEQFIVNIIETISKPHAIKILDGKALSIGAAVGIASCPEDAEDAESLLSIADQNMYKHKGAGGR